MGLLDSSVSALNAFRKGIDVVGNNVANSNSIGFKSSTVSYTPSFGNILQRSAPSSSSSPDGSNRIAMEIGNGVQVGDISTDFSRGSIENTEKETDMAIAGDGFFKVVDSLTKNSFLTRAGNFRVDDRGYLVTTLQGYRVQGMTFAKDSAQPSYTVDYKDGKLSYTLLKSTKQENPTVGDINVRFGYDSTSIVDPGSTGGGKLILTADAKQAKTDNTISEGDILKGAPSVSSFNVDPKGRITYNLRNGDSVKLNQIMVTNVTDTQALVHEGEGMYSGFGAAGALAFEAGVSECGLNGVGEIRSKSLELSNVDLTKQFASLIALQNSFQAAAKGITAADEILSTIANLKR